MMADRYFKLRVTFCDSVNNGFVTLGGAGFDSESEWQQQWDSIPAADLGYDDPWKLTLDKLDQAGDMLDERPISRQVAETLLGEPLETLITRGHDAHGQIETTLAGLKSEIEGMERTRASA